MEQSAGSIPTPPQSQLDIAQQLYPQYSKGDLLWMQLPLEVRHEIYEYNRVHYPHGFSPLSQTCRTFRREIQGYAMSQVAIFAGPAIFAAYITKARKAGLTPFISFILIDLTPGKNQFKDIDDVRALLLDATKELRFLTRLTFATHPKSTHEVARMVFILIREGTLKQFPHLEHVNLNDGHLRKKFRAYNPHAQVRISQNMRRWLVSGKPDQKLDTDAKALAWFMARNKLLDKGIKAAMQQSRKDSAMDS